jgi:hypothetical protein
MDAAKKKALSPAGLAVLRFMLLLVVTLFLPQTRVWGVEAAPQHASGKIAFASASAVGVIAPVLAYDASDCRVAADTAGALNQTYELGLQSSRSSVLDANRAIYDDFVANGGQLIQQRSVLNINSAGEQIFGSYSTVNNSITLYQGSNLGTLSEELIHFSQIKNAGYLYQPIPAASVDMFEQNAAVTLQQWGYVPK